MVLTIIGISETGARELDNKILKERIHQSATGVTPEEKDICFSNMY